MALDSIAGCSCCEVNSCSEFSVKFDVLLGLDTGAIQFTLGVVDIPGLNNKVLEEFEYTDEEAGLSLPVSIKWVNMNYWKVWVNSTNSFGIH